MPATALGPQSANYATARPATDPITSTEDTWFQPCTAGENNGTVVDASWLNVVVAQLRTAIRSAGVTLDDTNDEMLWEAIQAASVYTLPQATNTALGGVKLATVAQAVAGTDTASAVTPADLAAVISQRGCPCPPTAGFASLIAQENTSAIIDLSTLISGGFTSLTLLSGGSLGTTHLNGSQLTYAAGAAAGNDVITWLATNIFGTSNVGRVRVTVQSAAPPAPTVIGGQSTINVGTQGTINLAQLTEGTVTSWAITTAAAHATAQSLSGSTESISAPGTAGTDSFTFTATGPGGTSAPATVELIYQALAYIAPSLVDASLSGLGGGSASLNLESLTSNTAASWAIVTAPTNGCVASITGSTLTVAFPNATGNDSLTLQATGPGGVSNVAVVELAFTAVAVETTQVTASTPPAPTIASTSTSLARPGTVFQVDLSKHSLTNGSATSWSTGLTTSSGLGNGSVSLNGPILTICEPNADPSNPTGDCSLTTTVYASGPGGTSPGVSLRFTCDNYGDLPVGVNYQFTYPDGTTIQG